jgi:hypothetical protein
MRREGRRREGRKRDEEGEGEGEIIRKEQELIKKGDTEEGVL